MTSNHSSSEEINFRPHSMQDGTESIYKSVCHNCPVDDKVKEIEKRNLIIVSVICVVFMLSELVGGILANSLAIASDAAHLLSDFGAFMVSLAAIWLSSKPQTAEMSFGFHRAEVVGALFSVLLLWLVTGILVYMAVERIIKDNYTIDSAIMMYVAIGGILANIAMAIVLKYYKPEKSGNKVNSSAFKTESINIQSAFLHVLGDLIQSVGVLIASIIIYIKPDLKIVDPICTLIFSVIVLLTTLRILRDIFHVLMEGFPKHLDFKEVQNVLFSIPGIVKIHNLRMWSLTMDKVALSAHIVVLKGEKQSNVLKRATEIICRELNIYEVTLQVEEINDPVNKCTICS